MQYTKNVLDRLAEQIAMASDELSFDSVLQRELTTMKAEVLKMKDRIDEAERLRNSASFWLEVMKILKANREPIEIGRYAYNKIEAVKYVRMRLIIGLKEAKDIVDDIVETIK